MLFANIYKHIYLIFNTIFYLVLGRENQIYR